MESVRSTIRSLKDQRFTSTSSDGKAIRIREFEFVAMTQFLEIKR